MWAVAAKRARRGDLREGPGEEGKNTEGRWVPERDTNPAGVRHQTYEETYGGERETGRESPGGAGQSDP